MNTVQPLFPHLPEYLAGLEELAENLWWSWNPGARMLFKTLDRQAWKESGHNPDKMLREFPRELLTRSYRFITRCLKAAFRKIGPRR